MHAPDTYACSHQLAGRVPQGAGPEPGSHSDHPHLAELKALHQPRTQERGSCFIGLHHVAELLFSRQIEELEFAITSLYDREPDAPTAPACGGPAAELVNALRMHNLDWVRRAQHAMMVRP